MGVLMGVKGFDMMGWMTLGAGTLNEYALFEQVAAI